LRHKPRQAATARTGEMEIRLDDLTGPEIIELLEEHLRCMAMISPPESRHALDLDGLRKPGITFWSIWNGPELAGCGALKELDKEHGEVKSMRTAYAYRGRGVGSEMLRHIIEEGNRRGYRRLSLETGSMKYFDPARRLYAKFGFKPCAPFATYREDPNSVFMTRVSLQSTPH
jgi:putative acetyltransferase